VFDSANLALSTPGKVSLSCGEFKVDAKEKLELRTQGNWLSAVAGHSETRVTGRAELRADEIALEATGGDARLCANDDVRVVGERILLNSEHEGSLTKDQIESFWRTMEEAGVFAR
jgi:hypothetical protein